jgi:hypothetical protein
MSYRTQGRVDVEPPSIANSLRERAMASPRAWQAGVDVAVVDDAEDEVVEIFFSGLSAQPGNSPVQTADLFDVSIHLLVWTYTLAF